MEVDREQALSLKDFVLALRPSQWTKNVVVLAAFFFAFWDRTQSVVLSDLAAVVPALFFFCVVSSGIYILNDIKDIEADRSHPVKKLRPIAAGRIPLPEAWRLAILLLCVGGAGSWFLSKSFAYVVGCYILIQLAYSFGLKQIALVDVLVIAAGFVLRAIGGAVVLDSVKISPWLLLCTFLLALFLALCKRRHEKVFLNNIIDQHRPSLDKYDRRLLDQLIAIISSATIVSYAIYTLWPETVDKFGTTGLGFTIPFVVFGIFRYLDLVYRHEKGDRPERILLTDTPLLVNLALYGLLVIIILLL